MKLIDIFILVVTFFILGLIVYVKIKGFGKCKYCKKRKHCKKQKA